MGEQLKVDAEVVLQTFEDVAAASKAAGVSIDSIRRACYRFAKGATAVTGNSRWRYVGDGAPCDAGTGNGTAAPKSNAATQEHLADANVKRRRTTKTGAEPPASSPDPAGAISALSFIDSFQLEPADSPATESQPKADQKFQQARGKLGGNEAKTKSGVEPEVAAGKQSTLSFTAPAQVPPATVPALKSRTASCGSKNSFLQSLDRLNDLGFVGAGSHHKELL